MRDTPVHRLHHTPGPAAVMRRHCAARAARWTLLTMTATAFVVFGLG